MPNIGPAFPTWVTEWMEAKSITVWGAADLRNFSTPLDHEGNKFPFAIAWAIPMNPKIMASIQNGPNQPYADEYAKVNNHINELSVALSAEIEKRGFKSKPLAASVRSDTVNIKGDFPHKTVATRAGLGWVGRHCQLITRQFGSWVRLGTVFTDIELPCGPTINRNFCGKCMSCVEACPANAATGQLWNTSIDRDQFFDAHKCRNQCKIFGDQFIQDIHICGICVAVCPIGDGEFVSW